MSSTTKLGLVAASIVMLAVACLSATALLTYRSASRRSANGWADQRVSQPEPQFIRRATAPQDNDRDIVQPLPPIALPAPEQDTAPVPSLPAPKPIADSPEVARAKRAIMANKWWKPQADEVAIERIIDVLTDHGGGAIFFNQSGKVVWAAITPDRASPRIIAIAEARARHPHVGDLGDPIHVAFILPRGPRLSRAEAMFCLQDTLSLRDSAQLFGQAEKDLNDLLNLKP